MAADTVLISVHLTLCTSMKLSDVPLILNLIFVGSATPVYRPVRKMQLMCVDMLILLLWVTVFEYFVRKKREQFLGRLNSEMEQ